MTLEAKAARLVALVEQRSRVLVNDNIRCPSESDYLLVKSAMLIGAGIANEVEVEVMRTETEAVRKETEPAHGVGSPLLIPPYRCTSCGAATVAEEGRGWWCVNAECQLSKHEKDERHGDTYFPWKPWKQP